MQPGACQQGSSLLFSWVHRSLFFLALCIMQAAVSGRAQHPRIRSFRVEPFIMYMSVCFVGCYHVELSEICRASKIWSLNDVKAARGCQGEVDWLAEEGDVWGLGMVSWPKGGSWHQTYYIVIHFLNMNYTFGCFLYNNFLLLSPVCTCT